MLDDLISAYGDRFLVAALGVSLALICLFIVLWILRNRAPSPFVRGGRNRQPRLQVLDAAAVDTRRRIVLIRRDNVEHLVMIGGPTDIVIESGIGDERHYLSAQAVLPQALEDQSSVVKTAAPVPLASEAPPSAMTALPVTEVKAPVEAPVARPFAAEPVKAASPARPQPAPLPVAEERRPTPMPARPVTPSAEKPAPTVAPVAAVVAAPAATAVAAAVMAPRVAVKEPDLSVQPAAPVLTATTSNETSSRSAPAIESPVAPEIASVQPDAKHEPELTAKADIAPVIDTIAPLRPEPELLRQPARIEPEVTAGPPPVEAFRVETVEPIRLDDIPAPTPEITPPAPAFEPVPSRTIDPPAVEDVLDAARMRVLAPAPAPVAAQPAEPLRGPEQVEGPAPKQQAEAPARDISDFERVLEEEMALHLAADPAPSSRTAPEMTQILPETRADRPRPPLTALMSDGNRTQGAAPSAAQQAQEPNLQNEIARIFGEMSASRNP